MAGLSDSDALAVKIALGDVLATLTDSAAAVGDAIENDTHEDTFELESYNFYAAEAASEIRAVLREYFDADDNRTTSG